MRIILKKSEILLNMFTDFDIIELTDQELIERIKSFYQYGPIKPKVEIENNFIIIEFDVVKTIEQEKIYNKATKLCEKGQYNKAQPILEKLIKENPTISDCYRILGQIKSDMGLNEEAINLLIESIKLDPNNGYAYIMLGNIYAREKDDIATAKKLFEKALEIKKDDFIAINNIGAMFIQKNDLKEGKRYLELAEEINSGYPNTQIGLAQIYLIEGDLINAIKHSINAVKLSKNDNKLYNHSVNLLKDIAETYVKIHKDDDIYSAYRKDLEMQSGKSIELIKNENLETYAKIEIAEMHKRNKHIIRYNPQKKAYQHLIMHELFHLQFYIEAEKEGNNFKILMTNELKEKFIKDHESYIRKLEKKGFDDKTIVDVVDSLFNGLNIQMMNTPIDLFIEYYLFNEYDYLIPFQFISLFDMYKSYAEAINNKQKNEYAPSDVVDINTALSMVLIYQFNELFGIDFSKSIRLSNQQKTIAQKLYKEWGKLKDKKLPGEEFDLIDRFAEIMKTPIYFQRINTKEIEDTISSDDDINNILNKIIKDPFNLDNPKVKEKEDERFDVKSSPAGSMAVTMYCLDALQYFEELDNEKIKEIGFEIGLLGRQGISSDNPEKKYHLKSIPDKTFSGLHLLAFMFVAFKKIDENLDTSLDFEDEYQMALSLNKKKS